MNIGAFTREDYRRIRWQLASLGLALLIVAGAFFTVFQLNTRADRSLLNARGDLNSARFLLDQISLEEATIIENLDRYAEIAASGVLARKDPIDLVYATTEIYKKYDLFPIARSPVEKFSITLPYEDSGYEPGQPIELDVWDFGVSMPLLHENDLVLFLDALLKTELLLLPRSCNLTARTANTRLIDKLGEHFNSDCRFYWYTFNLEQAQK